MAAARRPPAGSRAGAGPAPRGPRRRFASSSRGPVSGSSRPLSAPAPGGRRRAHQRACNSHARRQFSAPQPGLATARPEVLARASITSPASWPPARCISMEPSRVLHIAATAAAAQTVSGT